MPPRLLGQSPQPLRPPDLGGAGDGPSREDAVRHQHLWAPKGPLGRLPGGVGQAPGVHGTFYRILGAEVSGLDGFYGEDIPEYAHMGVRIPENPNGVCDEVYEKTGVAMIIVDANDLNVELLGKASVIRETGEDLLAMVSDNPAGQSTQMTPFILIREVKS